MKQVFLRRCYFEFGITLQTYSRRGIICAESRGPNRNRVHLSNQSINQSTNQSINQSNNDPTNQYVHISINRPNRKCLHLINQSTNALIYQSTNEPVYAESINQSIINQTEPVYTLSLNQSSTKLTSISLLNQLINHKSNQSIIISMN